MNHLVSLLLGALSWSLVEYLLHRFVGHHGRGRVEFSREHLAHHANSSYFTPTTRKLTTAAPILVALGALAWGGFGSVGLTFTVAFAMSYAGYEMLHRRIHTHAPWNPYAHWARRHHFHHHYKNPWMNHGVTSPIWDWVFRTYETVERIRVPKKQVMGWLVDDEGTVLPQYRGTYEIAGRRR